MAMLVLGLVLFLGIHLLPTVPSLKARLVGNWGENRYKALFSIVAVLGLLLIIVGYGRAPGGGRVFDSSPLAIMVAPFVMAVSFVLFAAANMKTHIRAWLRHPMLLGLGIWALVHLLANGHCKATLLFGAFLAFAVLDLISAVLRNSSKSFTPSFKQDLIAIVSGVLLALLVMTFHRQLMGVQVVSWGM